MLEKDVTFLSVELPEDILKAKWCGDFDRAHRLIDIALKAEKTTEFLKQRLLAEKDILLRLPKDYTYLEEEAVALVKTDISDFTLEELQKLMDLGKIDWIYIQGVPHLATRFYETLLDVQPDIARRAGKIQEDFNETPRTIRRMKLVETMKKTGHHKARIRLETSVLLKEEAFRKEEILVHLPIPKPQKNMKDIRILRTYPENCPEQGITVTIGEESQGQRTVAFRETMKENHPFVVEYEYISEVPYFDGATVQPVNLTGVKLTDVKMTTSGDTGASLEAVRPADLAEVHPHIRFTPTMQALYQELLGEVEKEVREEGKEFNPSLPGDQLRLARKFYDYVTTKIEYSYMRQYFTLEEIPEYAVLGQKGDCGVQALTFITLCRMAKIPARWQSGLCIVPEFQGEAAEAGMHDWAMFYIDGLGWLFADCSYGGSAYRSGNHLLWNHYFGNLDADRMAANDAFQGALIPEKKYTRQDPYDNQAGEMEYESKGLLWDDFIRERKVLEYRDLS